MKFFTLLVALFLSAQLFALNINTASQSELESLNGIGEKTAKAIIEYRKEHKFTAIEEIQHVKGIGEKRFEKIKAELSI